MATVLIVDDHAVNRELLVTLLGYQNHRVLEAGDGAEALAVVRTERPDLVISDILMPVMDGYEFVRQMRTDAGVAPVPVIFYTAHYHKQEVQQLAKSCGVAHILMKPSEPDLILRTVDEALATPLQIIAPLSPQDFDQAHMRLVTDKLSQTADTLRVSNLRLGEAVTALQEREAGLSRAQHMAMLAHVITGPAGAFESWSATLPSLLGVESAQMPRNTREWLDILHPDDRAIFRDKNIEAAATGARVDVDYRLGRADGSWIQIRQVIEPLRDSANTDGNTRWFNTLQDVTLQKSVEEKITRLNRVHATLSGINTLIVRVRNRQELFNEACRIAVEHGGFGIAWIGTYDPLTQDITPVAWAGIDGAAVACKQRNTLGDTPQSRGMASRSIKEKKAMYSNDVASDANSGGGGRKVAIARGYQSLISLPLVVHDDAVGNLALFAKEPDFFTDDELKLLNQLADDISFALENIGKEEKIARLSRIQAVTSSINALIVCVSDRQELFNEACRIVVEHGGFGLAWIGAYDQATQDVISVACAGENTGNVTAIKSSARHDSPLGKGAVGQAIREQRLIFNNDIRDHGYGGPRLKELLRLGFRSQITLPLFVDQAVVATLTIYATEANFFDEEEISLLAELAGNISLAVAHIGNEEKISRLSRVQEVTSGINSLMVRVRDRQALLNEACRIAVEHGKFGAAWIGAYDSAAHKVTPVAWADSAAPFLHRTLAASSVDIAKGPGVVSRAIREKLPAFDNDITAAGHGARRRAAIQEGFHSLIALPFIAEGAVVGHFSLYSKETNFFNEDEVKLLAELAGNISFALEFIDRQEKLDKLSRIRAVSGEINAAIVRIHAREALLQEACRIASDYGKFELVWVGSLDMERQEVRAVAWTGFSPELAQAMDWAGMSQGSATLGEVIQTMRPAVRNDIETVEPGGILRHEALRRGYHSAVCLPLLADDKIVAAIILYAAGRNFFDADELALLNEVAADLSFALQSIARHERLEYVSYYDVLTGLPNRTLFLDRLNQQMHARSSGPRMVALVLINLERFRMVNETLGRHGGDEVLRLVAQRLVHACNGKDYLARVSADGFAVVVRGAADAAGVVHILEHTILDCFREPFAVNGTELRLAAKAGIALFPTDGGDADTLFKNAEAAVKNTRVSSERYLFYAADMNARAAQALSLETRLRAAMESQQFVLHYQPKIEFANGRVCGVEALIRWQDPAEPALVPPAKFIPVLEETGLILEVGAWAIHKALADNDQWNAAGLRPPRVAVNVSQIQLRHKDFVNMVRRAVEESKARPNALDLEITESLIMEDIENNIQKLKAVRDLGVNIAIDDFGTGYSSLGYLARLPVNALKIDRSFIITMVKDPDSMTIVATIISLAHSLNLKVIAEGVEVEEQSRFLKLLKCDEMQGYLFSKPLPFEQLTKMLEKRSAA